MAKKVSTEGLSPVKFLKPGTAYGYGYTAGEYGLISPEDFDNLLRDGIVQKVDMAEVTKLNAQYEKR